VWGWMQVTCCMTVWVHPPPPHTEHDPRQLATRAHNRLVF
jgi:hypothetical protein